MRKDVFGFLQEAFSSYHIKFLDDESIEIVNPFWEENIKIFYDESDDWTPFILFFSYQHYHLNDKDNIIKVINDIISGKKLAIEFFMGEKNGFGGDIEKSLLKNLSVNVLEEWSGYSADMLIKYDRIKFRGWNNKDNFDAVIFVDNDKEIAIKKLSDESI